MTTNGSGFSCEPAEAAVPCPCCGGTLTPEMIDAGYNALWSSYDAMLEEDIRPEELKKALAKVFLAMCLARRKREIEGSALRGLGS